MSTPPLEFLARSRVNFTFQICWIREIGGGMHFTLNAMMTLTGSTRVAQIAQSIEKDSAKASEPVWTFRKREKTSWPYQDSKPLPSSL